MSLVIYSNIYLVVTVHTFVPDMSGGCRGAGLSRAGGEAAPLEFEMPEKGAQTHVLCHIITVARHHMSPSFFIRSHLKYLKTVAFFTGCVC